MTGDTDRNNTEWKKLPTRVIVWKIRKSQQANLRTDVEVLELNYNQTHPSWYHIHVIHK